MRAPFNTLFGRLFGVLLVAIVLAHALAFFWFHHYGQPPPPPERFIEQPGASSMPLREKPPALGSAARSCP